MCTMSAKLQYNRQKQMEQQQQQQKKDSSEKVFSKE